MIQLFTCSTCGLITEDDVEVLDQTVCCKKCGGVEWGALENYVTIDPVKLPEGVMAIRIPSLVPKGTSMPQTVEHWQELAGGYEEVLLKEKKTSEKLRTRINQLEQRVEQQKGTVKVDIEPSEALLTSMATRYRHDFGLLNEAHQKMILTEMRQLHEEVVGKGFHKPK
ncbi:hypothetical protein [Neptuniibacter sp. QD37_11]|uniref:hypothetical protein n=1 Tax=Neptuniibacter sp. QD37_11 TaxID=3398209 RepID=UPI0039F57D83